MTHLTRGAIALVPFLLLSGGLEGQEFSSDQPEYVLFDPANPLTVAPSSASTHVGVVLTNGTEVQRLLRRGYRSLNFGSSVGLGTVVLRLEVAEDGQVTSARLVEAKPGGHHPALNTVARRAALEMVFEPLQADLPQQGRTLLQRITFRG